MTLESFLADSKTLVDAALDRWLPGAADEPRRLHEAMRYALFAGGKRLRPAIARAAAAAAGGTDADALPAMCALEMLHTYSLIHDDLPAIDDDDLRRGQPTCHVKYGDATAILAGDALQTQAFLVLARETPRRAAVADLVLALAEAAGTGGMVGGEMVDIEAEGEDPSLARVEWIHEKKTAALFRASAVMGGLAAGADAGQFLMRSRALRRARSVSRSRSWTMSWMRRETQKTLGKSVGKDRAARKMSYPAAVGLDASSNRKAGRASAATTHRRRFACHPAASNVLRMLGGACRQ